jgi:hypothetical protein
MNHTIIASELLKVAELLLARKEQLDLARIQQFRKDFLMLMKNIDRIDSYGKAIELSQAMNRWRVNFEEYIYKHLLKEFKDLKYKKQITEDEWQWREKLIRENTWSFVIDLGLPIQRSDDYWNEEMRFNQYQKEVKKWQSRVERNARTAWTVLKNFTEWYGTTYQKNIEVDFPITEQMEMEGFTVLLKGHDTYNFDAGKTIEVLKEGLKRYRKKAQILPWLLKYKLPILVDFYLQFDKGGEYTGNMVMLSPLSFDKNPDNVVSVLAHEMGHHLFRIISEDDRTFWSNMLKGGMVDLDLREAIKNYGDDEWIFENAKMMQQDPYLYNQLRGLQYSHAVDKKLKEADKIGDIRQYLDAGGSKTVMVYLKPISGYAHKNPDEAFSEAISNLVAYGPRAVPEEAIAALKVVLPNLRVASKEIENA